VNLYLYFKRLFSVYSEDSDESTPGSQHSNAVVPAKKPRGRPPKAIKGPKKGRKSKKDEDKEDEGAAGGTSDAE